MELILNYLLIYPEKGFVVFASFFKHIFNPAFYICLTLKQEQNVYNAKHNDTFSGFIQINKKHSNTPSADPSETTIQLIHS